jgi:hypothetical protein
MYIFHCAELHEFHNYSVNLCGQLPYLIVSKSEKNIKMEQANFIYVLE